MPDSKISALPSATVPLAGTEVLPIVQSSVTDKVAAADLLRQNGQTVTTSNPVLSLAQTWNAGAVTFTGLRFNATDTASAAASLLLDLQVGGTTRLSVSKAGSLNVAATSAPTMRLDNGTTSTTSAYQFYSGSSLEGGMSHIASTGLLTLSSGRSAVWGGKIIFEADTVERMRITSTAASLSVNAIFATDNTYDIGASGATRPRSIYTGTQFIGPDGSDASPSFTFGTSQTGMYRDSGGGRIRFAVGGTFGVSIASGGIGLASDTAFIQMGQSSDVVLTRDAANTLAQRNGTNAQTFRTYVTYTDASNYERMVMIAAAGGGTIGWDFAGTGSARNLSVRGNQVVLQSGASFTNRWILDTSGHFLAATDNAVDIGASGANRPRAIYAATEINSGAVVTAGSGSDFRYQGQSRIRGTSDGVITLLNNAATDFSRLQFGGTTSSFPSLKRSGTELQARLADDSGDATLTAGTLKSGGSLTVGSGTAIPAGGSNGIGLKGTSATNFGVFFGSGAPTLSAAKGSLYLRSDGSTTNDRCYVNTDGSTTWTAVTTAA